MRNVFLFFLIWVAGFFFFYYGLYFKGCTERALDIIFWMSICYTSPLVWLIEIFLLLFYNTVTNMNRFFTNTTVFYTSTILFLLTLILPINFTEPDDDYKIIVLLTICLWYSFLLSIKLFGNIKHEIE